MTFHPHTGLFGQQWIALSGCGHYAIGHETTDPRATKFTALFIPGVWATAKKLGVRATQEKAQALCEKHAFTPDFTPLAKGV